MIVYYDCCKNKHAYFPDLMTTDGKLYEVKSEYTFKIGINDKSLYNKIKSSINYCEEFHLIVYSKKGDIVKKFMYTQDSINKLEDLKNKSPEELLFV